MVIGLFYRRHSSGLIIAVGRSAYSPEFIFVLSSDNKSSLSFSFVSILVRYISAGFYIYTVTAMVTMASVGVQKYRYH
ncbi:hypothetical protein F5X99DRAFT_378960 [Biscogniauxia marginata]|nr:hypothetical protein F5X99DRAFT_378960 [Biscogniauxia marginata]